MKHTISLVWDKVALNAVFQGRAKQRKILTAEQLDNVGQAVFVYAQARQQALLHPSSDATAALFGHMTKKNALNDAVSLLLSLGLTPSDIPLLDCFELAPNLPSPKGPCTPCMPMTEPVLIQLMQAELL